MYGRRHSLRISGIPESHKEHTDVLICEFLKNELNIEKNMGNIDRSHRVGQKKLNLNRPIAVRFINYRLKEHVYANRMYLKKQTLSYLYAKNQLLAQLKFLGS